MSSASPSQSSYRTATTAVAVVGVLALVGVPASPQFGAWIGLAGWLVVILGLLFSAPRIRA